MVGIISVVIGGHFGGGDHFDGGDHFGGGTPPRHDCLGLSCIRLFFSLFKSIFLRYLSLFFLEHPIIKNVDKENQS